MTDIEHLLAIASAIETKGLNVAPEYDATFLIRLASELESRTTDITAEQLDDCVGSMEPFSDDVIRCVIQTLDDLACSIRGRTGTLPMPPNCEDHFESLDSISDYITTDTWLMGNRMGSECQECNARLPREMVAIDHADDCPIAIVWKALEDFERLKERYKRLSDTHMHLIRRTNKKDPNFLDQFCGVVQWPEETEEKTDDN
jgi:hypothetical protein